MASYLYQRITPAPVTVDEISRRLNESSFFDRLNWTPAEQKSYCEARTSDFNREYGAFKKEEKEIPPLELEIDFRYAFEIWAATREEIKTKSVRPAYIGVDLDIDDLSEYTVGNVRSPIRLPDYIRVNTSTLPVEFKLDWADEEDGLFYEASTPKRISPGSEAVKGYLRIRLPYADREE